MKIYDVLAFDGMPETSTATGLGTSSTVPGTRLRGVSIGYIGTGNNPGYNKGAGGAVRMFSSGGIISGNGGHVFACAGALHLADSAPELLGKTSTITFGFRATVEQGSRWNPSALQVFSLAFANSNITGPNWARTIAAEDFAATPAVGSTHYWEVVLDRVNNLARIYRDNAYVKTVDFSADVVANGELTGFILSMRCATSSYGTGSCTVGFSHMYLVEVEDGDICDRLGPQVTKQLPVSSVDAAWVANVPATGVLASLNDPQPRMDAPPSDATMTSVVVTDNDPSGVISFSTDGLAATDRIAAIMYQVDAISPGATGKLESKLLNGASEEETVSIDCVSGFGSGRLPALAGWAKKAHVKQFPAAGVSKAAVGNYKLKLRASA